MIYWLHVIPIGLEGFLWFFFGFLFVVLNHRRARGAREREREKIFDRRTNGRVCVYVFECVYPVNKPN